MLKSSIEETKVCYFFFEVRHVRQKEYGPDMFLV